MKKLIPLCLALILSLALAVPASAAESETVAVQVNGETVAFPNASPELKDGRTMVPMRAVLEALGAAVDYSAETQTVTATLGETTISHVIGEDKIIVDGDQVMTMDTASYVKSGSTLVPLRFFSQALGYEVYWDAGAHTAVVINKDAAIAEIDKSFTILNGLQAKQAGAMKDNMALDMDFSGEAKVFDSISGDQTLPFSMKMSALYGAEAMNMEGAMDLSALLAGTDETELPEEMAAMLENLSFKMIYSGEVMWMQMPALSTVLNLPEGEVWLKTSEMPALGAMGMKAGTASFGSILYAAAEAADAEVPVNLYDDLTKAAQLTTTLIGDETFTKEGENYSWKLDADKSAALADALGASAVSFPFTMEMTIQADGSSTFAVELSMDEITMSISGSSSASAFSLKGQMQVKNVCDLTFQGEAKMAASDKAPVAAPPADAEVLDLDELAAVPMPLPELSAA